MKRILSLLLLCLVIFSLTACASDTDDWQTVILNCGTMKVPEEWIVVREDEILYIYDEAWKPIMIALSPSNDLGTRSNKHYQDYIVVDWISSACYSNGAIYGACLISYNGETSEKLYLSLGYGEEQTEFIIWDESITVDMQKKIAKTYTIDID